MSKNEHLAPYANCFKNWPKLAGPKPTAEMLMTAHNLGCRHGKQALARALELREGGATDGQVKMACIAGWGSSGSHHNKRRDLVAAGLLKMVNKAPDSAGHKVYAVALTDKGVKKLTPATEVAAPAKPAKAKPVKPAKPAPAAVEVVATPEAPTAS